MSPKRLRGRPRAALFADIDPQLLDVARQEAGARGVHLWWVVEQAMRAGLPLIPRPDAEEVVLPETA
jgi:hypothetical protein